MDPNQVDEGSGLSRQIGPLKLWQWGGVVIVVAAGYLWWRNRQAGSGSSAVDNSQGGTTFGDVNSGDYSSGYDAGYASGLNASGTGGSGSGGTTTVHDGNAQGPLAHDRFTAQVKNPAGHKTTVTGYGTWVQKNGKWTWQVGIPRQFALVGNGVGTGASSTAQDVSAAMPSAATGAADAASLSPSLATDGSAATLDQATGTAGSGVAGGSSSSPVMTPGGGSGPALPTAGGATGKTISGQTGGSAPARTATNAQRIAQIVKDLQSPGPNFTAAKQQNYLRTYQQLAGHAYTGKLGQLQVGQHVQYATV